MIVCSDRHMSRRKTTTIPSSGRSSYCRTDTPRDATNRPNDQPNPDHVNHMCFVYTVLHFQGLSNTKNPERERREDGPFYWKKKKKEAEEEFAGQKFARAKDVEQLRLKRLRDEEDEERARKEQIKRARGAAELKALGRTESLKRHESVESLPREEVIRRLRLLGQPATFFGEDDASRAARLRRAQEEFQVEDEHAGGQQANINLELQKEEKLRRKGLAGGLNSGSKAKEAILDDTKKIFQCVSVLRVPMLVVPLLQSGCWNGQKASKVGQAQGSETCMNAACLGWEVQEGGGGGEEEDPTMAAFKRAAQLLKEKREEEQLPAEDRILRALKKWMQEWEEYLDRRPRETRDCQSVLMSMSLSVRLHLPIMGCIGVALDTYRSAFAPQLFIHGPSDMLLTHINRQLFIRRASLIAFDTYRSAFVPQLCIHGHYVLLLTCLNRQLARM
eukprot:jgi/Botrbrau1/3797/Bobra.0183s0029.1